MFDWRNTGIEEEVDYATFGCKVFDESPDTPDWVQPDVERFLTGAQKLDKVAPDGRRIRFWTFLDDGPDKNGPPQHPGPKIIVTQGKVVHTHLKASVGPHTVHHHGIEPSTANDGVGHVSFEVSGKYTYQWRPKHPGTYFYHCHRNTVLHFELGMWGPIIVLPKGYDEDNKRIYYEDPDKGRPDGSPYDRERLWAAHSVDPRWHRIEGHDAGMCGLDVGLNRYEPKYFLLNGVWGDRTHYHDETEIRAEKGERVLIRLLNASYALLRVRFTCEAELVGADGRFFGAEPWVPSTEMLPAGTPFDLAPAQRYAFIVEPKDVGYYPVFFEYRDWITHRIHDNGRGRLKARIRVT